MPIYDQGYQRWQGELAPNPVRWWPITRQGVWQFLPQRKYLLLLGISWVVMLFRGGQLFTYLRGGVVTDRLSEALAASSVSKRGRGSTGARSRGRCSGWCSSRSWWAVT